MMHIFKTIVQFIMEPFNSEVGGLCLSCTDSFSLFLFMECLHSLIFIIIL